MMMKDRMECMQVLLFWAISKADRSCDCPSLNATKKGVLPPTSSATVAFSFLLFFNGQGLKDGAFEPRS